MANSYFNITQEYLLQKYKYDSETGIVTTKYTRKIVGWNHEGYLAINKNGKKLKLHRLIWLMVYGDWPEVVDHINFNRKDNRLCNLRSITHAENIAHRNNDLPKSGIKYITYVKTNKLWKVMCKKDNKFLYLGMFQNLEDAIIRQKEFYEIGE